MPKKPRPDGKEAGSATKGKVFPKPFGIDRQRIRIKANAEETLKGAFLPFTLGQHTCSIIFEDASCGKFVYEVTGDTSLPQPFNKFRFQVSGCALLFLSCTCGSLCEMTSVFCMCHCTPCSACLAAKAIVWQMLAHAERAHLHTGTVRLTAKPRMPLLYLLDIQVAGDGPQTRDISLPWNNSQIDAARRTFLDRHPLAKNKEQVALAKGEGRAPLPLNAYYKLDGARRFTLRPFCCSDTASLDIASRCRQS